MLRAAPALVLLVCGAVGGARALDVRVNGDVLFAMHLSEAAERRLARARPPAQARAAPRPPPDPQPAPALACAYRLPDQAQVDAILSNMMNELTKVFVRANLFLKSEDSTRHPGVWRAEEMEEASTTAPLLPAAPSSQGSAAAPSVAPSPSPPPRPSAQTTPPPPARSNRFKVIDSKNTQFFEHIFHNMTEEFSSVYQRSGGGGGVSRARSEPRSGEPRSGEPRSGEPRSGEPRSGEPCPQEEEVRRAWRDLLRRSLAAFRRAALNCVQDYLKIQECEASTKQRLVRFLVRELGKMRSRHLQLLCARFQLCLDERLLA